MKKYSPLRKFKQVQQSWAIIKFEIHAQEKMLGFANKSAPWNTENVNKAHGIIDNKLMKLKAILARIVL